MADLRCRCMLPPPFANHAQSLGIFEAEEKSEEEVQQRREQEAEMGVHKVEVFGIRCPAVTVTEEESEEEEGEEEGKGEDEEGSSGGSGGGGGGELLVAFSEGAPADPAQVQSYLKKSFGANLQSVKVCVRHLAAVFWGELVARQLGGAGKMVGARSTASTSCDPTQTFRGVCPPPAFLPTSPTPHIAALLSPLCPPHRPEWKGWAVKSELSLRRIRELATTWKQEV